MPDLVFAEADPDSGYSPLRHLKAVMYFPADTERRRAFWQAHRKAALDAVLRERGWPARITREEYETIANAKWPDEILAADEERTIKRRGYLAASCLKYLLTIARHHPATDPKQDILSVKGWAFHVKLTTDARRAEGSASPLLRRTTQFDRETLRIARSVYMPVAHLWAAWFDDDGNERRVTDAESFDDVIALAEGYRRLAAEHGLYAIAAEALPEDAVYAVATEVDGATMDPSPYVPRFDPDEEWDPELSALYHDDGAPADKQTVYELAEARPVISPYPDDVVALLRREVGGQRKRKQAPAQA
ncbi:hypothetical protein [Azospirillum argentinense]|uniref:hypothetical protein n=1 Tax=Azospirillum argentinense TaxID=2970906 RepID=UPI0032DFEEF8